MRGTRSQKVKSHFMDIPDDAPPAKAKALLDEKYQAIKRFRSVRRNSTESGTNMSRQEKPMRRAEIIAKVIRENHTPRGLDVGIDALAEWIDEAIRPAIRDEVSDSYDRGYGEGWMDGTHQRI